MVNIFVVHETIRRAGVCPCNIENIPFPINSIAHRCKKVFDQNKPQQMNCNITGLWCIFL